MAHGLQISHRYSNSAALINAAFNFTLDGSGKTIKEACVVFGLPGALSHITCNARLSCTVVREPVSMSQSYCGGCLPKTGMHKDRSGGRRRPAFLC